MAGPPFHQYDFNPEGCCFSFQQEVPNSIPSTYPPIHPLIGQFVPADASQFLPRENVHQDAVSYRSNDMPPPSMFSSTSSTMASSSFSSAHARADIQPQPTLMSSGYEQGREGMTQWFGQLSASASEAPLPLIAQVTHDASEFVSRPMFDENWGALQASNAVSPLYPLSLPSSQGAYPSTPGNLNTAIRSRVARTLSPEQKSAADSLHRHFAHLLNSRNYGWRIRKLFKYMEEVEARFPIDLLSVVCIHSDPRDKRLISYNGSEPPSLFNRFLSGVPCVLACIRHAINWQKQTVRNPADSIDGESILFRILRRLFDVLARNTSQFWVELDSSMTGVLNNVSMDLRSTWELSIDAVAMSLSATDSPIPLAKMRNIIAQAQHNLQTSRGRWHPTLQDLLREVRAHFRKYRTVIPYARVHHQGSFHGQQFAPSPLAQEAGRSFYGDTAPSIPALENTPPPMCAQFAKTLLMDNMGTAPLHAVGNHSDMTWTDTITEVAPPGIHGSRVANSGLHTFVPSTRPILPSWSVTAEAGAGVESFSSTTTLKRHRDSSINFPSTKRTRNPDSTEATTNEDASVDSTPLRPLKRTRTTVPRWPPRA